MEGQRPLGNIEEQRDFNLAREKHTMENNRAKGGLNDGNPNNDHTPATASEEAHRELNSQQTGSGDTGGATS
jgi:hypothetical protein